MPYKRQSKVTMRLPKALTDELVSLGKLQPERKTKGTSLKHTSNRRRSKVPGTGRHNIGRISAPNAQPNRLKSGMMGLSSAANVPFVQRYEERYADEEDIMISELERKLGSRKGKSSTLRDDGLDDILEGIGSTGRGTKRKRDSDKVITQVNAMFEFESGQSEDSDDELWHTDVTEESEFKGFSDNIEASPSPVPPTVVSGKYIPPAASKPDTPALPTKEEDPRLRKQVQGLLNRLSESNMSTILADIEGLYRNQPRANVTSVLTNLILSVLTAQQSLLDTFVILHAGFVAALYRLIGIDFAAYLVQTLVERFDDMYRSKDKNGINLVVFLSELYSFGVVGPGLMYDLITMFLEDLDEFSTEALLKIVQNSGQQLRQDDPSALTDIVVLMQSKISSQDPAGLSVRTKFMVEMIINLKNNRSKASTAASVVVSEATVRMKKFLGKMGERNLRSRGEPLRVSLDDIRNVKEKGKWWLVGASWKDDEPPLQPKGSGHQEDDTLLSLAREQRMNTEIRRAIFIALMGGEDYIDASTRLLLLPLKKAQRSEISRVLVYCCSRESVYNPFYALVAKRLCSPASTPQIARVVRVGLQYNLWSAFREWGESTDGSNWSEEQDELLDGSGDLRKAVNLAKFYGSLVAEKVVTLQILKVLGFINLQPLTKTFLELFFVKMILHSQGDDITSRNSEPLLECTDKLADTVALAKGLDWYLKKRNVESAGLIDGESKECVAWGVGVLRKGIAGALQSS